MISKVVTRRRLGERDPDLAYWRARPVAERIAHVEALRAEHYGWSDGAAPRVQRVQLGHAPKRIDLLTSIDGVTFDDCWPDHVAVEIGGLAVPFIDVDCTSTLP